MTRVLCIDPGTRESGWVLLDADNEAVLASGKDANDVLGPRRGSAGRFVETPVPHDVYVARFRERVDSSAGQGACWPWMARCNGSGYGLFNIDKRDRLAHRLAYAFSQGVSLSTLRGVEIRHAVCDNPPCCNPAHLAAGTHAENMADMVAHDRGATGRRLPVAKLSDEAAADIRRRYVPRRVSQQTLADDHGVTQPTVWAVLHGKTWR